MHETNFSIIDDEYEGVKKQHCVRHLGPLNQIEEIDATNFDLDNFTANYLQKSRPLVIRNALGVFDCGTAYKNWTLDYLLEKCGSNKVHVRRNTMADDYKTGKAYFVQEIEFKSYIDDLVKDNLASRNSYLAVQNLKKAFPQIKDEFKMPQLGRLHAGPFLWIARSGHYEYTHIDPDDNLLMVIKGRKLVRLYGCDVNAMMPNVLGSKGRTLQSQINCDDMNPNIPDDIMEKYKNVTCHYCLLKEGDLLYFPAFWWHQVKSPELTISINIFFGDEGQNTYLSKILISPQKDALLYWLYNIIKQNMVHTSFPRILVNLKESLKAFLFKQWHEVIDQNQADILYNYIIDYFDLKSQLEELANAGLEKKAKNPPEIRIRGLLMRDKVDDEEKRLKNFIQ